MKIINVSLTLLSILALALTAKANSDETALSYDFNSESDRVSENFDCKEEEITPPYLKSHGNLYSCIGGEARTVKIFINAVPESNEIKNIKLMWNKWTRDAGYGVNSDQNIAEEWVSTISNIYFPNQKDDVMSGFFSDSNFSISIEPYQINYSYNSGPGIDEHLLTITPNNILQHHSNITIEETDNFELCKNLVSNLVTYPKELVSGDGDPIQENGYKSFMLTGQNNDLFFCEIHSSSYKIKAALEGNFPFHYIDEGDLKDY